MLFIWWHHTVIMYPQQSQQSWYYPSTNACFSPLISLSFPGPFPVPWSPHYVLSIVVLPCFLPFTSFTSFSTWQSPFQFLELVLISFTPKPSWTPLSSWLSLFCVPRTFLSSLLQNSEGCTVNICKRVCFLYLIGTPQVGTLGKCLT